MSADANYYVDLILRARDTTAEAFASATGNQKAFNAAQKESEEQSKRTGDAYERMTRQQLDGQTRIGTGNAKLIQQQRELLQIEQGARDSREKAVNDQVRLEQASQRYARVLNDVKASEAQRVQSLQELRRANDAYAKSLAMAEDAEATAANAATRRRAAAIQEINVEAERRRQLMQTTVEAAKQSEKEESALHQARMQRAQENKTAGLADAAQRRATMQEQERQLDRLRVASEKLADAKITPDDFDVYRKEIIEARRELVRLGVSGTESQRAVQRALRDSNSSLSEQARQVLVVSQNQERHNNVVKQAGKAQDDLTKKARDYAAQITNISRLQNQRQQAGVVGGGTPGQLGALDNEIAFAKANLAKLAAEIQAVSAQQIDIGVDVDTGAAIKGLIDVEAVKAAVGRDLKFNVDVDTAAATAKLLALQSIAKRGVKGQDSDIHWWSKLTESFQNSANGVSQFDNLLRGLLSLGVALFLNQIVVIGGAAAGALAALASSAIYAGGALGGALVAGISQAIPVLGVIATAISRVRQVTEAIKQQNLIDQQTFGEGNERAKKIQASQNATARAQDAVAGALDRVGDANRRVKKAQEDLTQAREAARRGLLDLILAERSATLAARGAVLSQAEAQDALRGALSSGDTGALDRARLQVDESDLGVDKANLDRTKARDALSQRREGGVEGTDGVKAAKESLADARRGVADAKKSVDDAKKGLGEARKSAQEAGNEVSAATRKLNYLMAGLTDQEKKLYTALRRLGATYKQFAKDVSGPLIASFTNVVDGVTALLLNPRIVSAAKSLSAEIGKQFESLFKRMSSGRMLENFLFFAAEAKKNLEPVTRIIGNLAESFANIGRAASPAFRELLDYFVQLTDRLAEWTASTKGQNALGDFFKEGVKQLKGFMRLGGAVAELIMTIANPKVGGGAKTGLNLINDMTRGVEKLNAVAGSEKGRKFLTEFFERSRRIMAILVPIFKALGEQFARLFTDQGEQGAKDFTKIFVEVLIPALGDFLIMMGLIIKAVAALTQIPGVSFLLRFAVAAGATAAILSKLALAMRPLVTIIGFLGTALMRIPLIFNLVAGAQIVMIRGILMIGTVFTRVGTAVKAFAVMFRASALGVRLAAMGMFGPWGLVVAGVVAGITLLAVKFGIFSKIWDLAKRAFRSGLNWIKDFLGIASPAKAFIDIGDAIIDGLMMPLRALRSLLVGVFNRAFNGVKSAVRAVISFVREHWKDILTIMTGPLGLLVRLVAENFDKITSTISRGITSIVNAFKALPGKIKNGLSELGSVISGVFKGAINLAIDGLNLGIEKINKLLGPRDIGPLGKSPDLRIPEIPNLATGGYIAGNYAAGDIYPAMLSGEEVVLNPRQQGMIGKGRIMDVLAATGAQIIGGGNGRYASGAGPAKSGTTAPTGNNQALTVDLGLALTIIVQFGRRARSAWDTVWDALTNRAKQGNNAVNASFRSMYERVDTWQDRIGTRLTNGWDNIAESVGDSARDLRSTISETMASISKSVYDGMKYVGTATNTVLKDFDADPVKFSISPPTAKRAATGWIGNQGERGGDAIPIMVGRGEAVLNWAQQQAINNALGGSDTLEDILRRNHAYHAGGPQSMGMPGFAKGGLTGPFGSGAGFNAVANFAKRKFGMSMTSGRTNHSVMSASGNISDHSTGNAGDFSNGSSPTPQMDAFNSFFKNKVPEVVKQLIWRNKDQFNGYPIGGHMDHVHLAMPDKYAMNNSLMARLISRKMRGLSIEDLVAGNVEGGGTDVEHIANPKVGGPKSGLRSIIARAINKVRMAANAKLDSAFGETANAGGGGPVDYGEQGKGALSEARVRTLISQAMKILGYDGDKGIVQRAFTRQAYNESTFNPNAQNKTPAGVAAGGPKGLLQVVDGTFAAYMKKGYSSVFNPLHNILASMRYVMARYGSGNLQSGAQALWARGGGAYARGGFVGGAPRRAATGYYGGAQDTSRRRSIALKGTYRAPEVGIAEGDFDRATKEFSLAMSQISNRIGGAAKKLNGRTNIIVKNLTAITREGGLLDAIGAGIEKYVERAASNLSDASMTLKNGTAKMVMSPEKIVNAEIKNMQGALSRYKLLQRRIATTLDRTTKQLAAVNRQIDKLEDIAAPIEKIDSKKRTKAQSKALKDAEKKLDPLREDRQSLLANQRDLKNRAEAAQRAVNEQLAALFQAQMDRFAKAAEKSISEVSYGGRNTAQIEQADAMAGTYGDTDAQTRLKGDRLEVQKRQAKIVRDAAKTAKARGYADLAKQYEDQFTDLNNQIALGTAELFVASLDAIIESQNTKTSNIELQQKSSAARGTTRGPEGQRLEQARLDSLREQAAAALRAAAQARNAGAPQSLISKYESMFNEISVSIEEAVSAQFQGRIDAVNEAATRGMAAQERRMGMGELVDRVGGNSALLGKVNAALGTSFGANTQGGIRTAALEAQGTTLTGQRTDLQALLREATNPEQIQALTDQLADLDKTIADNIVAQHENTIAVRQAAIEAITARQQFLSSTAGGLLGLVQAVATNSNTRDPARTEELMNDQKKATAEGLSGLEGKLFENFGIDARGLTGTDLVDALKDIDFEGVKATLSDSEKAQFEGLISGIIGLGTELENNTAAINSLNGAMNPQGFTSSAWAFMRTAIFDGMGSVLPQYDSSRISAQPMAPALSASTQPTESNTAGRAASRTMTPTVFNEGDIIIDIDEAGGIPDPNYMAARMAFERRAQRGSN